MDPISNMLIAIKNAYMAKKLSLTVPYSKYKLEIAKIIEEEKFVKSVKKNDTSILIELLYEGQKPKITQIKRISKPGLRVYSKSKHIKPIRGGRGFTIISTPKGVMTGNVATRKKLGGEIICQIW